MRLQDLKSEVAWVEGDPFPVEGTDLELVWNSLMVARRVADLYDTCPDCRGTDCELCLGTGVVPVKREPWDQHRWPYGETVSFAQLARCLFGEGT